MRVQYVSDLHIELHDNSVFMARGPLEVAGDVLVIAGDTLPLREFDTYRQHRFFDWCADNYRETFLVPGNHEYYRDDVAAYPDSWERELRSNVRMCENRSCVLDDTEFILSTLWTHIPMSHWLTLKAGMSDFSLIRCNGKPLTASSYNALHERDLAFIRKAVSESRAAHKVVVTHHVPSRLLVAPEHRGSSIGCGFVVDLTDYIASSGVDLWVYGHSHRSIETLIGKTRMASNQIGYVVYGEHERSFDRRRSVDLDDPVESPAALAEPVQKGQETILLPARYGKERALVQTSPDSPWYTLEGAFDYISIQGDDPILAVDPDGGPFISVGGFIGKYQVMAIRMTPGEGKILINLKNVKQC